MVMDAQQFKILLVDDSPNNIIFLSDIIIKQGYKIQIEKLTKNAVNTAIAYLPDLILLVIRESQIESYEICQQLKSHTVTQDIPIIFLNVLNTETARVKVFQSGGVDYLTEPLQAEEVIARIETQLKLKTFQKQVKEYKKRELTWQKAYLSAFFCGAPVGMNILDNQLRFVQINELLAEIHGCSQAEHLGKTLHEVIPEIAPLIVPCYEQVLQTGKPILNVEVSYPSTQQPDVLRYFLASYFPISGDVNNLSGVGAVLVEISNGLWQDATRLHKQTEIALQESQQRYQTLAEASPVGIFHTDSAGNCLYVNQRWSEITGLSPTVALGNGWTYALHISDRDRIFTEWYSKLSARQPFKSECHFTHPDGRIVWVICQTFPEIGKDGKLKGCIGTITDITDRKLAEDALRESAEREQAITQVIQRMRQTLDLETIFSATTQELRQVLNCDRVVVFRFHPDWSGEFVAESVENGWVSLIEKKNHHPHLTESTLQNESCFLQTAKSVKNPILDTYLQAIKSGIFTRNQDFLCVPDIYKAGLDSCHINLLEEFQAKAYITVPIFCGNQLWGLLASYQNSTPRQWKKEEINIAVQIGNHLGVALQQAELLAQTQRQSQALQKAVTSADAANRAKSEFLTNMSHELRTPLNVILGFTQVMNRDSNLSSEHQQNLAIINRAGEHLLNLINDILEMSKIEAGRTTLNVNSFDLILLLDSLQQMLHIRAAAKDLELVFEYAPEVPRHIITDSSKLRQVLLNLLGNAIKFTDSGSVKLKVSISNQKESTDDLISTASYLDASHHFTQSHPLSQKPHYTTLQLKEAPLSEAVTTEAAAHLHQSPSRLKNPLRTLVHHQTGLFVENSKSPVPQTATSLFASCANSVCLHFQVIDTGHGISPEEIELLFEAFGQTEIGRKSQQGTGLGLAISRKYVQLMGGEISVSSTVGVGSTFAFDIQVTLPYPNESQITATPHCRVKSLAPGQSEYRILVVDDAKDSRILLVKLLENIGFVVKEAANGTEAICIWETWQPQVILMDMRMPVMDGYEATREIRAREKRGQKDKETKRGGKNLFVSKICTVIIALSANVFEEQRQAMISAGCTDFINKPFREQIILEKLSQYLGVRYLYQTENRQSLQEKHISTEQILYSGDLVALLSTMPPEWLIKVHHAAAQCSDDLILELLKQIPTEKSLLVDWLKNLAQNFQFKKIMELTTTNTKELQNRKYKI
ncbi:response regulator [Chlorogloeopsis sp. ULAP01]|uniref:response regulator n=1 Tax=Chlorogloeopsis sp. ULAP01 TaxID=3056483 RepID=UPI0025AAFA16|nr:response regulator [Chlorogloeopsis sp. ULAP01]MDM9381312.1 response regulator [Chlorogloeopsis sp. ULAP01]